MTQISIQALEGLVGILPPSSTPHDMVCIAKWAADAIEVAKMGFVEVSLIGTEGPSALDDIAAVGVAKADCDRAAANALKEKVKVKTSAPVQIDTTELAAADKPVLAHLQGLKMPDGWCLGDDIYLVERALKGWTIGEVATDLNFAGDVVKKRFDDLLGRDSKTRKQPLFLRDDVLRVLKQIQARMA